ncbi:MAG: hypothetical protein ABW219_07115, partial [Ilumatobacteraceae bacterium]
MRSPRIKSTAPSDHRSRCPVAHSDAHGGFWAIVGYDELVDVADDAEGFPQRYGLSVPGIVSFHTSGDDRVSLKARTPADLDPQYHEVRRVYNSLFSPPQAARWEVRARVIANRLIDDVIEWG